MLRTPQIQNFTNNLTGGNVRPCTAVGHISKIVGLTVEATGPISSLGDVVSIKSANGNEQLAEVVGFKDKSVLLFPLDGIEGVRSGDEVLLVNEGFSIPVGYSMLGRVVDGLARPLDRDEPIVAECQWKVRRAAPNSMTRKRITEPFHTSVRSIDSAMTCGNGQRVGIFAGSGVGKSTLMGMIARNSSSDVNVIALIGERGKEVLDFIEESLGEEGLKKSVLVVSTSDKSPLQRVKGAETAMAIAEFFRDQGKNVLFMMDSVTRYAMAQREVGLAIGEPPATKGYPPSVFSLLPALLERAGTNHLGSITGFFTVLVEGDDMNDPIADTTRGILDGHLVLSRELAQQAHFPAVDVLQSVSRVMTSVAEPDHVKLAQQMRKLMAAYKKAEDMINIGAYKAGSNPEIDLAVAKKGAIDDFLSQETDEKLDWTESYERMKAIFR